MKKIKIQQSNKNNDMSLYNLILKLEQRIILLEKKILDIEEDKIDNKILSPLSPPNETINEFHNVMKTINSYDLIN